MLGLMIMIPQTNASMVPQGENWLNPDHVDGDEDSNSMFTKTPIELKPNATYHMNFYMYAFFDLEIRMDGDVVLQKDLTDDSSCEIFSHTYICAFETGDATEFDFVLSGQNAYQHFAMWGTEEIMLAKGADYVLYEPFISGEEEAPEDSDLEFDAVGSLEVSYTETRALTTLVKENIHAYDEIDGDLSDDIEIIHDDYTDHASTTGEYDVHLSVEDASGNIAYFHLIIDVINDGIPEIDGPSDHVFDVETAPTLDDYIQDEFSFYDDYEGTLNDYTIINDDYSSNKTAIGTYAFEIEIENDSGTAVQETFTITLKDYLPPVIMGPSEQTISYTETFDIDTYIESLLIEDNQDTTLDASDITLIENNYVMGDVGVFTFKVEASDASGNTGSHTLTLNVIDDIPPMFSVHERIDIIEGTRITHDDLLNHFKTSANLNDFNPSGIVITDDYDLYNPEAGEHQVNVELYNDAGDVLKQAAYLNVEPKNASLMPTNLLIGLTAMITAGTLIFIKKKRLKKT